MNSKIISSNERFYVICLDSKNNKIFSSVEDEQLFAKLNNIHGSYANRVITSWDAFYKISFVSSKRYETLDESYDVCSDKYIDLKVSNDGYLSLGDKVYKVKKADCKFLVDVYKKNDYEQNIADFTNALDRFINGFVYDEYPILFLNMGVQSNSLHILTEDEKELLIRINNNLELERDSESDYFCKNNFYMNGLVGLNNNCLIYEGKAYRINEECINDVNNLFESLYSINNPFINLNKDSITQLNIKLDEESEILITDDNFINEFVDILGEMHLSDSEIELHETLGGLGIYCDVVSDNDIKINVEVYNGYITVDNTTYNCYANECNRLAKYLSIIATK